MNFQIINHYGNIVNENNLYKQHHDKLILNRYDSNFIEFKEMPTFEQFIEVENYLKGYHKNYDQTHLKFIFPENKDISSSIVSYIQKKEYSIGILEMYKIDPKDYKIPLKERSEVHFVTSANLDEFLTLQFEEDLRYGVSYATAKTGFLKRLFMQQNWRGVIIYENNVPVGSLELIIKEKTVEIDNLFINEKYRKKGYASQLQAFVMKSFMDKMVVLLADGEDTVKDMYQKQGYEYIGYQKEVLKIGF